MRKNVAEAKRQLALFSLKATEFLRSTQSRARSIIVSMDNDFSSDVDDSSKMEYLDLTAKVFTEDGEEKIIYRSSMGYPAVESDKVVDGIISQMFDSFMNGVRFAGLPSLNKIDFYEEID
jgi:hypothetical protein